MRLPKARGALSDALFSVLRSGGPAPAGVAAENRDDAAIALWSLYELHYRGFEDVAEDAEWDPDLLRVRRTLEVGFEADLGARAAAHAETYPDDPQRPVGDAIFALTEAHEGPSLADHVQRAASEDQVLELLRQRSVYHLKEADPTSWVIPRLEAEPKAALLELQFDEYGCGRVEQLHHRLFERGMISCGLRAEYGAYVDEAVVEVLEQNNAMSLFGLHRRLRGAALGHLAAFEATSSLPSRRVTQGLERLGMAPEVVHYYAEHVEADAAHEQLAARIICGALVDADPTQRESVLLGVRACLVLEDAVATRMLAQWEATA
ncbi:MAG: iron-containing redox enzyme family protein [Nocardioides sp.]|nr:iron-containing redox enzyme family protein [Nocardioides sp.]